MKTTIAVVPRTIPISPSEAVPKGEDAEEALSPEKSASRYWTYTFGLVTFPFVVWGCPFFVVTRHPAKDPFRPLSVVGSTKGWIKRVFDFRSFPGGSILALLLLIPSGLFNAYVAYVFGDIFNHLFIAGTYEMSMFHDLLGLIRYLPVIVPLDYVWLRGFHVNTMITRLNVIHSQYGGVGCGSIRVRLILMILVIGGIHGVRWYCYERYQFALGKSFLDGVVMVVEFSVDLFVALLLPLYCTFCYAVKFQLFAVKALIYRLVSQRVTPKISHLERIKILYTEATNHILLINDMFSLYLSAALVILIVGTFVDSESLWRAILKITGSGGAGSTSPIAAFLMILAREVVAAADNGTVPGEEGGGGDATLDFTPSEIRELNADFACILITYGLMAFTIWQAVATNDLAREAHVWLNDFVTGGGGTDVTSVLLDLDGSVEGPPGPQNSSGGGGVTDGEENDEAVISVEVSGGFDEGEDTRELVWGRNTTLEEGEHDQFLKKFRMLKAYMHSRMQLEKAGLLNITLVGLLVPPLSSRLRRYQLLF